MDIGAAWQERMSVRIEVAVLKKLLSMNKSDGRVSSAAFVCGSGACQKKNPRPSWNVEIRFSPVVIPSTSLFLNEPL